MYLEKVNNPNSIKKFNINQLITLCSEIRKYIEDTVFNTGGHLSSNFGVVELTVALHYVYNFLEDTIIFDVSHQAYTHKILTGRKEAFAKTLRQYKGISGYTNPDESPYDHFMFAHAGTSISTSLGIANAKKIMGYPGHTIAVVGDASISCGMSLEAINHAGQVQENLLVVLNDNCMSIAPTVGSFSKYLQKIRLTPMYQEMKKDFSQFLRKIPLLGDKVNNGLGNLLDIIKYQCTESKIGHIFEELNFQYYGPVDGHNIELLIDCFNKLKNIKGAVLLHVMTEKGKGHTKALDNPEKYHGVSPLKKKSSNSSSTEQITFTNAFSDSLIEFAKDDNKIIAITAAMSGGTGLNHFNKVFPDRYFDVGICEQHAMGFAAGQAVLGLKPVCAIYSTFLQRCYDQIFQEVCLNNNPVIMVLDRAGIAGQDGPTHAGVFDIAYLRCFPNIILMSPRNSLELKEMLKLSLTFEHPSAMRIPRDSCNSPFKDLFYLPVEYGKSQVLIDNPDSDIILIGYGVMANICLEVAENLDSEIKITVINARFVKPLDEKLFKFYFLQKKIIITLEDHSIMGGFGSALLELASKLKIQANIHILGVTDSFTNQGSRKEIFKELGIDSDGVIAYIKKYCMI